MLPTEEARLRRWPRHDCAPSGCAPTHAICRRPRNPHRPRFTKQRPSSPRFPPCEAFERRPPAARPTVVQGADVRNPSAFETFERRLASMFSGHGGRGRERLNWAGSAPTRVGSGGPECEPKLPFHREHEIGFTALCRHCDIDLKRSCTMTIASCCERTYAISIRIPVPPFSSRRRWYCASASTGDSPTNAAKAASAPGSNASSFAKASAYAKA